MDTIRISPWEEDHPKVGPQTKSGKSLPKKRVILRDVSRLTFSSLSKTTSVIRLPKPPSRITPLNLHSFTMPLHRRAKRSCQQFPTRNFNEFQRPVLLRNRVLRNIGAVSKQARLCLDKAWRSQGSNSSQIETALKTRVLSPSSP